MLPPYSASPFSSPSQNEEGNLAGLVVFYSVRLTLCSNLAGLKDS